MGTNGFILEGWMRQPELVHVAHDDRQARFRTAERERMARQLPPQSEFFARRFGRSALYTKEIER